ncbi:hypothetical protein [Clostridium estertheticum]|uniref:hypothetical protein n=1 Tax=Clostridium estertheticum TaxID=238834 RepID=UPI001C7D0409|nr:hypothetical protein [Clostridium estertheticum]MBX4267517.1 hypothetical protein [Clostridium estertheticum]WLC91338.1 hypothetical protein KTC95_24190 [Clostridium estertheticum]
MNKSLEYKELKKLVTNRSYKIQDRYTYIEQILNIDTVKKSYGNHLFDKITEIGLYFITTEKIIKVGMEPFIIKTYNLNDIQNTEVEMFNNSEITLKICMEDNTIIEFNNKKDAPEDWENTYLECIFDISNYLVNLKAKSNEIK